MMLRMTTLALLALAALWMPAWPVPATAPRQGAAGPAKGQGRALLVGCSHYPNLEERYQLKGPANDVLLMRDLLVKYFGFAAEHIVILAEHAGKDRLPTRANIEQEFRRL